jgi:hypothetical protein
MWRRRIHTWRVPVGAYLPKGPFECCRLLATDIFTVPVRQSHGLRKQGSDIPDNEQFFSHLPMPPVQQHPCDAKTGKMRGVFV